MATSKNEQKKPRVPLGKMIPRSEEEVAAMTSAEAMESLLEEMGDDWKENAPSEFRNLQDAGEVEEE